MNPDQPPTQIRVHGVGGPQARKMLGLLHDEDVVTISQPRPHERPGLPAPAPAPPDVPLTFAGDTRFARRADRPLPEGCAPSGDVVEAYEWGGLTTGSLKKALWVIYLPMTLLNAAGWAHGCHRDDTPPFRLRLHQFLVHLVAGTATATYLAWIAYITLDLVAVQWRATGLAQYHWGLRHAAFDTGVPALAVLAFVGAVVALGVPIISSGRYERDDDPKLPAPDPSQDQAPQEAQLPTEEPKQHDEECKWSKVPPIGHRAFFDQPAAYRRLLLWHLGVAIALTVGALWQYAAGWNHLGLVIIVIAIVQTALLSLLGVVDVVNRWVTPAFEPGERPGREELEGVWRPGPRFPVGAALAVVGIALAHAALSALAMTSRSLLLRWPGPGSGSTVQMPIGAELGASDILVWALALSVVFLIIQAVVAQIRGTPVMVTMARQAVLSGSLVAVAVAIPTYYYAASNGSSAWSHRHGGNLWAGLVDWYDGYEIHSQVITQSLGQKLLLAIPPILWAVLSRPHDTGIARIIGNIWDVLTFWPRRFQPFAVPCTAERAVPELRSRIIQVVTATGPSEVDQLTIIGHSQGSVLAAAAIASVTADACTDDLQVRADHAREHALVKEKVRLVTFGSPLGALYTPTWPAYIIPLTQEVARPDGVRRRWTNFWRDTDPIGASVPGATNRRLADPRQPDREELAAAGCRVPLERPPSPTASGGHSGYLTDPAVYRVIEDPDRIELVPEAPPKGPFAPTRLWAHQGGACEGPSNTLAGMRRGLGPLRAGSEGDPYPSGGANALELDVHLTSDAIVVVSHDAVLGRRTDHIGRIATTDYDQLHAADAAFWFQPTAPGCDCAAAKHSDVPAGQPPSTYPWRHPDGTAVDEDRRIPTLDAVLDAFPSDPMTIEVKRLRAAHHTVAVLQEHRAAAVEAGRTPPDVTITALYGYRLGPARRAIHQLGEVGIGIGLAPGRGYIAWFRLRVALRLPPSRSAYTRLQIPRSSLGIPLATRKMVAAARAAGMEVDVWTINKAEDMRKLIDLGVDGIMTDRPSVLAEVCAGFPLPPGAAVAEPDRPTATA